MGKCGKKPVIRRMFCIEYPGRAAAAGFCRIKILVYFIARIGKGEPFYG
jgi:hypothetical protein